MPTNFVTADGKPYNGDITTLTVRGQDFNGFVGTVDGLSAKPDLAKQSYELYAKKDWASLEALFKKEGINGGWPPNRGFIDMKPGVLKAGDAFDRFGGRIDPVTGKFVDTGRFVAPYGADFGGRALPQSKLDGDPSKGKAPDTLKGYKIIKDIPVTEGDAIPWFGQPGGGKQYELPEGGIDKLIADGYIVETTAPDLKGKTDTNVTPTVDGGDGVTPTTDGGGMKGANVYPEAPAGQRVSEMTPGEIAQAVQDAAGRKGRLMEGVKVTPSKTPGTFTMSIPDPKSTSTPKKSKTIEVVINTNFDPKTAKTGHGADQGAAMNTITVKDGKITATVELGGNHNKADADKMMAHELSEIADITSQIEARQAQDAKDGKTTSDADLQKLIAEQQQASVFKEGGSANEADMTAHDRSVVAEIGALAENVANATDPAAAKAATDKLRKLAESMGIKDGNDPRLKLIEASTGRLNGEQLAAISGHPAAPDGYRWVRNGDGSLTVENLPGNDGPVMDYKPGATPPFEKSKTARPKPENLAVEAKSEWQLGDTKSAKNEDGVHTIEVNHSDLTKAERERLDGLKATRDAAKDKKDNAKDEDTKGDAHGELVRASEALGDAATDIAISRMLPGAEQLPSDIPGDGKSGQFDRVYIDGDQIYIVESKGGSSELGSRKDLNNQQSQQGTPEYIASVIQNMSDKVDAGLVDPRYGVDKDFTDQIDGLESTVTKLRIAQSSTPPKITSLQISQRVDSNGSLTPTIEVKKFENFSVKAGGEAHSNP